MRPGRRRLGSHQAWAAGGVRGMTGTERSPPLDLFPIGSGHQNLQVRRASTQVPGSREGVESIGHRPPGKETG